MNMMQPSSTLVPLYEARLAHAEANMMYWANEYARHGDPVAESAYNAAQETIYHVRSKLTMLKQPGSVSLINPKLS